MRLLLAAILLLTLAASCDLPKTTPKSEVINSLPTKWRFLYDSCNSANCSDVPTVLFGGIAANMEDLKKYKLTPVQANLFRDMCYMSDVPKVTTLLAPFIVNEEVVPTTRPAQ